MSLFKRQLAVPLLGTEEFINDTIFHFMYFNLMIFANNFEYRGLMKGAKGISLYGKLCERAR